MNKVAIVIPVYKEALTLHECIALQQCERILGSYPKILVTPPGLDTSGYKAHAHISYTQDFDAGYFENIAGYNRLMLSSEFYQAFQTYEYILIYQLDAFVFKDKLTEWCTYGWDYVGAPWIRPVDHTDIFKAIKTGFQRSVHTRFNVKINNVPSPKQFENKVGNGGFSLRRVGKFLNITQTWNSKIAYYLNQPGVHEYNEDAFWSIEVNRSRKILNIPKLETGLKFAFELSPERALRLNGGELPFGCHAWDKHLPFWRPYFASLNYTI
jgi:hypothetical protein